MLALTLVSCGGDEESSAASKAQSQATTSTASKADEASKATSEEASEAESEAASEESEESEELINGFPAEECVEWNDTIFHIGSGNFELNSLGHIETTGKDNIVVAMDETFTTGKISVELVANGGEEADNDNGFIFGLEENDLEYFWELGRSYYFLFVSDNCSLYLAKVAYNDQPWTELKSVILSEAGITYSHGATIKISAEVLEGGIINCYANDELVFSYEDSEPLTGTGYGLRGEWEGVSWKSITVEKN
jgi:hypothetical protein